MSIIDGVPITGRESLDIRKAAGKKAASKKEAEDETRPLPEDVPDIASLKSQKYRYSASTGNNVTPLIGGEQIFSAAEKVMKGAEKTIQLQMYRLGYDKVIDVLAQQAREGVKVQVVLDPTPGYDAEDIEDQNRIRKHLKSSGVELLTYPEGSRNKIDHVKLLIVDGRIALIGGMNWDKHSPKNQDADVLIEGPAVADLGKVFKDDWNISDGKAITRTPKEQEEHPDGDAQVRVIETDEGVQDIRKAMMENIGKAKKSIKIEAFVLCDRQVIDGLIEARKRGVDVKVILDPNKPVFFPNLKTEKILQEAGIEVRWLNVNPATQEKLHAKIATFDDETTIIGSCNFTYQGLTINHEADVEVVSKSVGTAFEKMFQDHWDNRTTETVPKLPDFQELTDDAPPEEQAAKALFRYFEANWSPDKKHNWVGKRKAAIMEATEAFKPNGSLPASKREALLDFIKSGGLSEDDYSEQAELIGNLAGYFSQSGMYDIVPAPEETKPLWRVRLEIAAGAAERNPKEVPRWKQEMIDSVETPALKALLKEGFEKAPPGYYESPSASSGRFHPADEVNHNQLDPEKMGPSAKPADVYTGGGLVLHTRRVVKVAEELTTFLGIKGVERDHIIAAAALHDIMKSVNAGDLKNLKPGDTIPWTDHTTPDHGLAGAIWLSRLDSAKNGTKTKDIARFVEKHMSAWNKPETSPPTDFGEMVVSMSDYIASQPGWYVKV